MTGMSRAPGSRHAVGGFFCASTSHGATMQTAAIAFLAVAAAVNGVLIILAVRAFLQGMRGSVDSFADPE